MLEGLQHSPREASLTGDLAPRFALITHPPNHHCIRFRHRSAEPLAFSPDTFQAGTGALSQPNPLLFSDGREDSNHGLTKDSS